MKKIFLIFFLTFCYSQTNITTPFGSTGFGIWMTTEQAFKEDVNTTSLIFDLHLPFGLEMLFGKSFLSNADYSFNQFGLAYDVKVFDWGFKVFEKRYDADDFDFIENFEKQETGIELYRRGRKLNSFFRYSKNNYNNILNPYDDYFSIGGVGRMTRLYTFGFAIKSPMEKLLHMRYSSLELTLGTSF
ncbi:MAG: hypothetical protein CMG14_01225 [Candidatus Marinimicrobia bacterium]|nr:hypothetical protein [Candidatus Neomarinimicrobiota bacterium]|tara:strand:+ start:867 stop:1427 length:561 start_codon:yes stop_codon:yes gene_type:complete